MGVFYEVISQPSVEMNVKAPKLINAVHNEDWRAPIVAYLKGYHEPKTKEEEKWMQQRARGYRIINDELYKASITPHYSNVSHLVSGTSC